MPNLTSAFIILIMAIGENIYFGWNGFPKSDAELIAYLIVLGVSAIVFAQDRKV